MQSFASDDEWRIAAYVIDRDPSGPLGTTLRRVEFIGLAPDAVVDFVANAACVTRTTVLADVAKIVDALKDPSELAQYRALGIPQIAAGPFLGHARGSVIGAPCFDPRQSVTNDPVRRRVIGVLGVWGGISLKAVVDSSDLRYVVEQYAKAVASFLRPQLDQPDIAASTNWTLPDIEIMRPGEQAAKLKVGDVVVNPVNTSDKVPKYERIEVFPHEALRITGYSEEFEPYTTRGEQWLQFGPGFVVSKGELEAFARGSAQQRANTEYVQTLTKSTQ